MCAQWILRTHCSATSGSTKHEKKSIPKKYATHKQEPISKYYICTCFTAVLKHREPDNFLMKKNIILNFDCFHIQT